MLSAMEYTQLNNLKSNLNLYKMEEDNGAYTKQQLIFFLMEVYKTENKETLLERIEELLHSIDRDDIVTMWMEII